MARNWLFDLILTVSSRKTADSSLQKAGMSLKTKKHWYFCFRPKAIWHLSQNNPTRVVFIDFLLATQSLGALLRLYELHSDSFKTNIISSSCFFNDSVTFLSLLGEKSNEETSQHERETIQKLSEHALQANESLLRNEKAAEGLAILGKISQNHQLAQKLIDSPAFWSLIKAKKAGKTMEIIRESGVRMKREEFSVFQETSTNEEVQWLKTLKLVP